MGRVNWKSLLRINAAVIGCIFAVLSSIFYMSSTEEVAWLYILVASLGISLGALAILNSAIYASKKLTRTEE